MVVGHTGSRIEISIVPKSQIFLNLWLFNIVFRAPTRYYTYVSVNIIKVRKTARIRNRYNKVPHLSQDTKWESNNITINKTNKSQEVRNSEYDQKIPQSQTADNPVEPRGRDTQAS